MMEIITDKKPIYLVQAAPIKKRLLALLIDYLVILAYGAFLVVLNMVYHSMLRPLFTSSPVTAELMGFIMMTLPVFLYFSFLEASNAKGTIGKRKAGVIVVNHNGGRITMMTSIIRSIVKFLPWEMAHFAIWRIYFLDTMPESVVMGILIAVNIIAIFYAVTPFMNNQRKAVHDWAAGTIVILK